MTKSPREESDEKKCDDEGSIMVLDGKYAMMYRTQIEKILE